MSSPRRRPSPRRAVPPPVLPPPSPPMGAEYTERLVVPSQIALAVVSAVAAAAILLALGLWPLAVVAVLAVGAAAAYLGVQQVTVTATHLEIAQGRGDSSPRVVHANDVVDAEVVTLSWPQCFGIGVPDTVDTTRFTVRAGPAVSLTLRDGEQLRISAADPRAMLAAFPF